MKAIEVSRAEVYKKYMDGLNNEDDLENELKKLLSANNSHTENIFHNAEMER